MLILSIDLLHHRRSPEYLLVYKKKNNANVAMNSRGINRIELVVNLFIVAQSSIT